MKKFLALFLAAFMVLAAVGCGNQPAQSDNDKPGSGIANQQLSMGTASSGGAYYVIGTGFAEVLTSHIPELNVTAEITDGSVANIRLVSDGDCDIGISNADAVQYALDGSAPYNSVQDIQVLCALHSSIWHVVTTENSGISSIADLKGKKVAVGPAGGGSVAALEVVLQAYGMTLDDITPTYVGYDDGITQLTDGQVSAALAMAGMPAAAVSSMAATNKVVMVSIDDEHMQKIQEIAPYYNAVTVPAATYNMDSDAVTIGVKNIIYVSSRLDDATVYEMTKALVENLDELKGYHSAIKDVTKEGLADVGEFPLAAGAEKYYVEAGLK